jgi:uncharacterized membrane protein
MAETTEELKDKVSSNGSGGENGSSRLSSLAVPAVATAATAAAAGLAVSKGPDLLKKLKGEANEEGEELGKKGLEGVKKGLESSGPAGKLASKFIGGGGGGGSNGGGQKGGKTRRLPIQRWTDVAVPVDKAYKAWTQWEEWPKFMHRVLEAKPSEDENGKIEVREKIWFWTREWEGEITERRKNDRIAWKTVSGMQHSGVVSFHKLDNNLTRVMVDMDFVPTGVFEKMASGMRFVKRAVQADLARFKAYVEFGDAKDLEYKSSPAEMEQNQGGDDDQDEDEGDSQDAENRGESESDESDDRDRDSEREERANRREERQKALSSS